VYSTNVIADLALDAIRTTPADKPLFLYFAPYGPHGPATPAPRDKNTFTDLPPFRPPSFDEADVSDKPAWVRALPRLTADKKNYLDLLHRRQAEALQSVDRALRDIVEALDAAGRLDRAVLIFVSDNGLTLGEHRWAHEKNCVYEECIRVPLQVRAPGATPRFDGHLISAVDLAPTIADFADVTPPIPLYGRSFKPLLVNPGVAWRDGLLIEVLGLDATMNQQAVRTKDYVYAEYQNGDRELYDLAVDPFQLENVVDDPAYASVRAALRAQLNALRPE
jgi:arylsulfatase A-like enzyme